MASSVSASHSTADEESASAGTLELTTFGADVDCRAALEGSEATGRLASISSTQIAASCAATPSAGSSLVPVTSGQPTTDLTTDKAIKKKGSYIDLISNNLWAICNQCDSTSSFQPYY